LIDPETGTYVDGGRAFDLEAMPSVLVTDDWYWVGGDPLPDRPALNRVSKDGTAAQAIVDVARFDSFTSAGGSPWVTGGDRLYRISDEYSGPAPSPQSVFPAEADAVSAEIAIEGPAQVASDGTTLWLLERTEDGSPRLTEIDPVTGIHRSAPVELAGDGPVEMSVADGDAWVSFRSSGLLVNLDAAPSNDATPDDRTATVEPLVIHISGPRTEDGTYVSPRFQVSYVGTRIPLDAIETPGAELEYPVTESPVALPAGTTIIIEGEYRDAAVFELRHFRGDYVEEGACLVPTPLGQIPDRDGPTALFIFAEWSDSAGGYAFRTDVVDGAQASSEVDDPETQMDGTSLGLVVCDETA
jgi:hypothetical protein